MDHRPDLDEGPVLGPLGLAVDGVGKALGQDCWAMAEPTLGAAFTLVDELQRDLDRLAAALVAEVQVRGVASAAGAGGGGAGGGGAGGGGRGGSRSSRRSRLTEWTRAYAPAMPEWHRHQLVRVAAAVADDRAHRGVHGSADRPTLAAFATGLVRLHRADLMLTTMAAVRPFLTQPASNNLSTAGVVDGHDGPDGHDGLDGPGGLDEDAAYQGILLPLAATGTDRDFATVAAHLAGLLRPEDDAGEADRACRAARSLTERPGPAGMTEFRLRADPVDAGTLRAAVAALSAPVPDRDGPDPRTAAQRRADALLAVVRRGMAATSSCTGHHPFSHDDSTDSGPDTSNPNTRSRDDTDPSSHDDAADGATAGTDPTRGGGTDGAATRGGGTGSGGSGSGGGCPGGSPITLVITMTLDQLTGAHAGVGTTESGHPIPAALARRMACDAAVIPAVLGAGSQVLDLGRTHRLATPAQRQALAIRDGGRCSYPGCTIPASWCDVHHLIWWSRGGRTDLDQLTLLCRRHHTTVHDRNLTGTIDPDGHTTWDLHRWDITRQ